MFEFWRSYAFGGPPFVHPDDNALLRGRIDFTQASNSSADLGAFLRGHGFQPPQRDRFAVSLYPVPYIGDLATAEIIVLLLNPGYELADVWEMEHPEFKAALRETIYQDLANRQFKFICIDPQFSWHSGFRWWERRLRPLTQQVAARAGLTYSAALRLLAAKLGCIELVPYRSAGLTPSADLMKLPSVTAALALVTELAQNRPDITWLLPRQVKRWSDALSCAHVHPIPGHTRSVSFSPSNELGAAIAKRIGFAREASDGAEKTLRPVVKRLVEDLQPDAIYLFGSHARNEAGPDSDFDLMVLLPDDASPERCDPRRPYDVLRGTGIATDIVVWRRTNFEKQLHLPASLPATIADEGRVLYAKDQDARAVRS
jgi:predicted nucleotidyltransferase